ncbi:putative translation elongation factor EFTs/EF1B [Medicago truncatula]|uniref:Putative translation elongation factor EFTs/EF1B n=1 Tax=Medicago truncatula TaxID=3880 RepID=A0A396HKJ2_MEDTR|nr:putative translation elongation factor EFTs/EF1B [Medicago truncatula]
MMDCKNALSGSEGDIIKAQELLREKGLIRVCRQESIQSSCRRKDGSYKFQRKDRKSTVVVSASLVKQLQEETGAEMMDCKKVLAEKRVSHSLFTHRCSN